MVNRTSLFVLSALGAITTAVAAPTPVHETGCELADDKNDPGLPQRCSDVPPSTTGKVDGPGTDTSRVSAVKKTTYDDDFSKIIGSIEKKWAQDVRQYPDWKKFWEKSSSAAEYKRLLPKGSSLPQKLEMMLCAKKDFNKRKAAENREATENSPPVPERKKKLPDLPLYRPPRGTRKSTQNPTRNRTQNLPPAGGSANPDIDDDAVQRTIDAIVAASLKLRAAQAPPSAAYSSSKSKDEEGSLSHAFSSLSINRRSVLELDPISESSESLPSLSPDNDHKSPSSLVLSLALDDDPSPLASVLCSSSGPVARRLLPDDHSFAGGAGTDTAALGSISDADSGAPRRSRRAAPSLPFGADLD
ncbi:hypothetical protein FB446DRAFT_20114 [Lentinula raphanica]|nr:hypothetical protein FB446DRAFT_20114 [Lentinula raphanica]